MVPATLALAAAVLAALVAAHLAWRFLSFLGTLRVLARIPHARHGLLGDLRLLSDRDHVYHAMHQQCEALGGGLCYLRVLWVPVSGGGAEGGGGGGMQGGWGAAQAPACRTRPDQPVPAGVPLIFPATPTPSLPAARARD